MGASDHAPLLTADGFNILSLVRPNILALEPYRCARDDYSTGILLDANENSYGPAVDTTMLEPMMTELERYPDPLNPELKVRFVPFAPFTVLTRARRLLLVLSAAWLSTISFWAMAAMRPLTS